MAEALGRAGGKLTVERRNAKSEILKSLSGEVDPATISYPLAGWFMRFLIETYGMVAVKRVYSRAEHGSDTDELRRLFEDEWELPRRRYSTGSLKRLRTAIRVPTSAPQSRFPGTTESGSTASGSAATTRACSRFSPGRCGTSR